MRGGKFLLVTFGVSWFFAAALWPLQGEKTVGAQILRTLLSVAFMFGPFVGSVVAQRGSSEGIFRPLGVVLSFNRWWLLAWIAPFAYAVLAFVLSLPLPGVEWTLDLSGYWERMSSLVPPEQLAEARREMEAVPRQVFWLLVIVQPLIAGPTVNALAAFGEELGWRGYLYREWSDLGFWRSSLLIGLVWGIWHAPLIAQGHNYPEHPYIGIGFMVVWCTLLAPPFAWLRMKTESVVAVSIAHGTLNACAGIPLVFTGSGMDLLIGVSGVGGFIALAGVNVALAIVMSREDAKASRHDVTPA